MASTKKRIAKHKEAKRIINKLYKNLSQCLIIHYSSESLDDINDSKYPRITSIAIRFPDSTLTKSFSIHKMAEIEKYSNKDIEAKYDILEKKMLKSFYQFVNEYKTFNWINWKMNDINFGFESIKHRAKILGIKPIQIIDKNKFELSALLYRKYGDNYIDHPRLTSLVDLNNISKLDFLPGKEEVLAFRDKNYVKLHKSTIRKVASIDEIFQRSAEEKLITNSSLLDKYGLSGNGLLELIREDWRLNIAYSIILILIGVLIRQLFI